jgi:hypothetical protein
MNVKHSLLNWSEAMKNKMDEMEMSINLKAIRISWVITVLLLFGWIGYEWFANRSFNWMAFIIMDSQLIVYWGVQLILKWSLGKNEE